MNRSFVIWKICQGPNLTEEDCLIHKQDGDVAPHRIEVAAIGADQAVFDFTAHRLAYAILQSARDETLVYFVEDGSTGERECLMRFRAAKYFQKVDVEWRGFVLEKSDRTASVSFTEDEANRWSPAREF